MTKRTEKKIDELIEAFRAFQGEMKKSLLEANREQGEIRTQLEQLVNAHHVDGETGKISHEKANSDGKAS